MFEVLFEVLFGFVISFIAFLIDGLFGSDSEDKNKEDEDEELFNQLLLWNEWNENNNGK